MERSGLHARCTESARAEVYPDANVDVSGFSSAPASVRALPAKLTRLLGTVAAFGLIVVASTSPGHAQAAPPLGTVLPPFAVLAGSAVTNIGPTTLTGTAALPGNVGAVTRHLHRRLDSDDCPGVTEPLDNAIALSGSKLYLATAYDYLAGQAYRYKPDGPEPGRSNACPGRL